MKFRKSRSIELPISAGICSWFERYLKGIVSKDLYFRADDDQFIIGNGQYPGVISISRKSNLDIDLVCDWDCYLEGFTNLTSVSIPLVGYQSIELPVVSKVSQDINIGVDFISFVIATLLRYEEYNSVSDDLDFHGRFMHESSIAFKYGFLDRPIVDEWIMILKQIGFRIWPDMTCQPSSFCMELSHDVDLPAKSAFKSKFKILKEIIYTTLISRKSIDFLATLKAIVNFRRNIGADDVFNTFDFLMSVSESISIKSQFYFIAGGTHSLDADYRIDEPAIKELIEKIHCRGHSIGLHPSYDCYLDSSTFEREVYHLRCTLRSLNISDKYLGSRMHYLRFSYPETLRIANDCGMEYESSMAYAGYAGFRCGTCKSFQAYDLAADTPLPILIRPLIAMDASVISSSYMNLGVSSEAAKVFIKLKEKCRLVDGCFSLLWHNSELDTEEKRSLYKHIVTEGI